MHVTGPVCSDGIEEPAEPACLDAGDAPRPDDQARFRLAQAASEGFDFIWRLLRRLGVRPEAAVDDAVQRVFEIAVRKTQYLPAGTERAFLFRTALFVAAEERRRQHQTLKRAASAEPEDLETPELDPERALAARRERELLDVDGRRAAEMDRQRSRGGDALCGRHSCRGQFTRFVPSASAGTTSCASHRARSAARRSARGRPTRCRGGASAGGHHTRAERKASGTAGQRQRRGGVDAFQRRVPH